MKIFLTLFCLPLVLLSCPFCDPTVLEKQAFYEDDYVIGLYDLKPVFEGHSLAIPKRHVERFEDLTETEMVHLFQLIKKIDLAAKKAFQTNDYMILQKNGVGAGQTVNHVHFHYIPRKQGEESTLYLQWRFFTHLFSNPISDQEMKEHVDLMKYYFDN